jgi:hypothetical protein
MINDLKVVCFYTPNGIYPEMANRLKSSCDRFQINNQIQQKSDLGSWVRNCGYKSDFLYEQVTSLKEGECILWLDSDAVIVSRPDLLYSCEHDFAIHARPGGRTIRPAGREEITLPEKWNLEPKWFESGTVFIRKTKQTVDMLALWKKLTAEGNRWDQWTLQEAWSEIQPNTLWLPRSYCQIHKLHGDKDAVILHDLASVIQKVNRL